MFDKQRCHFVRERSLDLACLGSTYMATLHVTSSFNCCGRGNSRTSMPTLVTASYKTRSLTTTRRVRHRRRILSDLLSLEYCVCVCACVRACVDKSTPSLRRYIDCRPVFWSPVLFHIHTYKSKRAVEMPLARYQLYWREFSTHTQSFSR
jgi:hypothetical protein